METRRRPSAFQLPGERCKYLSAAALSPSRRSVRHRHAIARHSAWRSVFLPDQVAPGIWLQGRAKRPNLCPSPPLQFTKKSAFARCMTPALGDYPNISRRELPLLREELGASGADFCRGLIVALFCPKRRPFWDIGIAEQPRGRHRSRGAKNGRRSSCSPAATRRSPPLLRTCHCPSLSMAISLPAGSGSARNLASRSRQKAEFVSIAPFAIHQEVRLRPVHDTGARRELGDYPNISRRELPLLREELGASGADFCRGLIVALFCPKRRPFWDIGIAEQPRGPPSLSWGEERTK